MSSNIAVLILKIFLFLAGIAIIYTGINISFGGMQTLGLQGSTDFIQVTDQKRFLSQDSHIRFLGGLWLSFGLMFIIGSLNPVKFQMVIKFCLAAMFFGGVTRFTQLNTSVTLGPEILPSLLAELILMPLLFIWVTKISNKNNAKQNVL